MFELASDDPKRRRVRARLHPSARERRGPWRWPLVPIANREPAILATHDTDGRAAVDLGYAQAPYALHVPVYAAQAGEVSFAVEGDDGCSISLDHGEYSTHYARLSRMFVTRCLGRVRRRQYVRQGTLIGYAAESPPHIRFELWQRQGRGGFVPVDPVPQLETWTRSSPARPPLATDGDTGVLEEVLEAIPAERLLELAIARLKATLPPNTIQPQIIRTSRGRGVTG